MWAARSMQRRAAHTHADIMLVDAAPSRVPSVLKKTVDQCLCGFEIGSFETLGEPIVDRREKRNRLCGPILVVQQLREARGGAQFPAQGFLPARPTERLPVVIFGRRRGSGPSLQQQKLAFDAQQLGNAPEVLIALGSR